MRGGPLAGAAEAFRRGFPARAAWADREQTKAGVRAQLDQATFDAASAEGEAQTLEQANTEAL